jgi:hypothetical protein
MNKLIAGALFCLGVSQALIACGDDDDRSDDNTGGTGGSSTAGSGGKASGGSAALAGSAGKGGGGSGTGGSGAGKGGTGEAGDNAGGVPAGVAGDNAGGVSAGGAGGEGAGGENEGGAGGAPATEPVQATPLWLSNYCEAKSIEVLGCSAALEWAVCFDQYYTWLSTTGGTDCVDDDENVTKLVALYDAFDALANACPDPDESDWECNLDGDAQPKSSDCADAEVVRNTAYAACVGG